MKNYELIQYLARFPASYEVWVATPDDTRTVVNFLGDEKNKSVVIVTDDL